MRSSTSFAILALLATAGTSLGAPVQYRDTNKLVNTKDGKVADVDAHRVANVGVLNAHDNNKETHDHSTSNAPVGTDASHLTNVQVGNDKSLSNGKATSVGPLPNLDKPLDAHSADQIHPVTGTKNSDVLNITPVTNDKHLKDDKVAILPNDKLVSGKDGIVDVQQGNLAGHVIQTPGKDKTIADVQLGDGNSAHKTDTKVNLPADGPAGGLTGPAGGNGQAGNVVSQLVGKPGQGPKQIVGLDPIAEVNLEKEQKPKPSHAPAPSSAKPSHPASSHPPQASKPAAKPSASAPAKSNGANAQSAPSSKAANVAPSSAAARPSQSSHAAPSHSANSNHAHSSGSHSSAPHSSASAPKPSQSAKGNTQQDDDDEGGIIDGGAFRPTRPGNNNGGMDNHSNNGGKPTNNGGNGSNSSGNSGNSGKNRPNRLDNGGDGHTIGLASSTRRGVNTVDLRVARIELGKLPQHVRPCDTHKHHGQSELVDACIEADLLAYAPKHTFRCPDELQHEIHIHEDTAKDATLNTKLSKEVAKYIRLCVNVGAI